MKYILIGGVIGIIIGFVFFIIGLTLTFDEWYFASIGFPFGLGEWIGRYFGFEGWGSIIPYFLGGIIIYAVLGMLISLVIICLGKNK